MLRVCKRLGTECSGLVRNALGGSAECNAGCLAQVRENLQKLDGYFLKLADAMEAWIDAWEQLNPAQPPARVPESKALPAQHASMNGNAN